MEESNLLIKVPRFKLLPEHGRKARLDEDAEQKLLASALRVAVDSLHRVFGDTQGMLNSTRPLDLRESAAMGQERVDVAVSAIRLHVAAAKVDGIVADFSGPVGAEVVIAKLHAVDVLVNNNVGAFEPKPFAGISDADWYRRLLIYCSLPNSS